MRALLREWLSDAGYRVPEVGLGGVQREGGADLVIASVYKPKQEEAVHEQLPSVTVP
jgi:hypothetical protein